MRPDQSLTGSAQARLKLVDIFDLSRAQNPLTLQRVGMQGVELRLKLKTEEGLLAVPAKVDVFVSLDDESAKGIHMSRLYRVLEERLEQSELSTPGLADLVEELLKSQKGLSSSAVARISWTQAVSRAALKSELKGWRHYPLMLEASLHKGQVQMVVGGEILYSSTCPYSAALSRQLIQQKFAQDFSNAERVDVAKIYEWLGMESSIAAVPHAQRSRALFKIKLKPGSPADPMLWINELENVLKTPVQAAVRREDEQEFARLNAANLMFCEDAARRLAQTLDKNSQVADFFVHVEHQESLHAHDAVAQTSKGLSQGY